MADADAHRKKIAKLCIFCGSTASKKTKRSKKNKSSRMTLNDILVLILKSAVEGLSDTGAMSVKKVMAVDRLQSVAKHNFISPIMFGSNLVMYSISRKQNGSGYLWKLHPGGGGGVSITL